jgi:flavin-dependent dehydrogenase
LGHNTNALNAYDVVVLGGGPAGCAAAMALRTRGVARVLIVDAGGDGGPRIGESIPPDTRLLFARLGLWEDFVAEKHEPCLGSCASWGDDELGYNDFLFNPHGTGWHLDRRRFDVFLARKAAASGAVVEGATRFDGAGRVGREGFVLRLTHGGNGARSVRARFVVDATGSHGAFARCMGARRSVHDRLSCVAALLELPAAADFSRLTMLEAVEYGWWYAARVPDRRLAIAVASDPDVIKEAALHARDGWLARLRETRHLSGALPPGWRLVDAPMMVRTASSFVLDRACGPGWLAAGDAASAYDPISSQGIYKALLDGLQAADAIVAWLGGDPGGLDAYHASVAARFADYLENRNYFYELEQRWPSAPFWSRRRAKTVPVNHEPLDSDSRKRA